MSLIIMSALAMGICYWLNAHILWYFFSEAIVLIIWLFIKSDGGSGSGGSSCDGGFLSYCDFSGGDSGSDCGGGE